MPDGQGGHAIVKFLEEHAPYLLLFGLALWGGTASYVTRQRRKRLPFSIVELIGEWSISGFAGVITAFLCSELGLSFGMTAAMTGVAGHMGGRAISLLEDAFVARLGKGKCSP